MYTMKKVLFLFNIAIAVTILNSCSSLNGVFYDGGLIKKRNAGKDVAEISEKVTYNNIISSNRSVDVSKDLINKNDFTRRENNYDLATTSDEVVFAAAETKKERVNVRPNSSLVSNSLYSKKSKDYSFSKTTISQKDFSYRQNTKSATDDVDKIVIIILCFFIPPLAVYLYEGSWTSRCTLNLILTLLCGLPGVIHALLVVLK